MILEKKGLKIIGPPKEFPRSRGGGGWVGGESLCILSRKIEVLENGILGILRLRQHL